MIITIEADRYFHITGLSPTEIEDSINTAVEMARDHSMKKDGRAFSSPATGLICTQ